jgi:hypothetical protein
MGFQRGFVVALCVWLKELSFVDLCGGLVVVVGCCVVVVAPWVCVDFLVVVGCRCGVLVANIVWLGDYGKQIIKNELFYNILIG